MQITVSCKYAQQRFLNVDASVGLKLGQQLKTAFSCVAGIRRIRMALGLQDPHPYFLVKSTDPVPDASIIKQK
jgi:hypothetical protein